MTQAIRLLQAEIEYSVTPLPLALRRVGERCRTPCDVMFRVAADHLQDADMSVLAALQKGIETVKSDCALQDPDFAVLEEIAKVLGGVDRAHLTKQFQATIIQFESLEREAEETRKRNERLWQYLGVLAGLLLVILLY